jgi:hypothetical protein
MAVAARGLSGGGGWGGKRARLVTSRVLAGSSAIFLLGELLGTVQFGDSDALRGGRQLHRWRAAGARSDDVGRARGVIEARPTEESRLSTVG